MTFRFSHENHKKRIILFHRLQMISKMAYVPPHMRNKQVTPEMPVKSYRPARPSNKKPYSQIQREKADAAFAAEEKRKMTESMLERTEDNFPALGNTTVKKTVSWNPERKFTDLVNEWKADDDSRKEEEELENSRSQREEYNFVLPHFRTSRRFAEPEDDRYEEELPQQPTEEDEWTRVEKKTRKAKSDKTFEEFEKEMQQQDDEQHDDTVWGALEEHETCWDERRH